MFHNSLQHREMCYGEAGRLDGIPSFRQAMRLHRADPVWPTRHRTVQRSHSPPRTKRDGVVGSGTPESSTSKVFSKFDSQLP